MSRARLCMPPRPALNRRTLLPALAVVLTAVLGACGGEDPSDEPGLVRGETANHIHGLGINPADGALYIATHNGLLHAPQGRTRARLVGTRRQDTMGFTVLGADRFLGSGHPDLRDKLPPMLGLIRSDDRGRTWTPVSLLGEADFHVLRARGRTVYGFDATQGRLMASTDAGRTWEQRRPPAPLIDLVIDPADAERLIASGPDGLYVSPDGGRGWNALHATQPGLLAWRNDALLLIDADGRAHRSTDGGRTFSELGDVGGQPAAVTTHRRDLYVATHDNVIRWSRDGGRTWTVRARA